MAKEHGKVYEEAKGDVLKAMEATELAISTIITTMGESIMDASKGYDTVMYREPLGVFAGIAPFNFPAMIPMGWMAPNCIAAGNTMVLKVSGATPMTSLRFCELYREAGLPGRRTECVFLRQRRSRRTSHKPRHKGHILCGLDKGRSAHIRHGSRERKEGAGSVRGKKPRPRAC